MDNMEMATIRPGTLSVVLKISSIIGASPLSVNRLRNGYSISVSCLQMAYSFFVITAFNLIGLIAIVLNLIDKKFIDFQSRSTTLLIITERMMCIFASSIVYMGGIRTKNMINHLNILEKIRIKINYGYTRAKEEKNLLWISSIIIITSLAFTFLEIMLIALRASEHYNLSTAKARLVNNGVRSLTRCYVSVCDVVTKINNDEGLYIFLIYTSLAIFSVFDGYRLILILTTPSTEYRLSGIMLQCGWCIMIVVRITFFIEPFQRVSAQVTEMKVFLSQMMHHITPLGNDVSLEIDIMMKQVILNIPHYCPLGIDTLNRSLITTTSNVIITFLVFLIQLQT